MINITMPFSAIPTLLNLGIGNLYYTYVQWRRKNALINKMLMNLENLTDRVENLVNYYYLEPCKVLKCMKWTFIFKGYQCFEYIEISDL